MFFERYLKLLDAERGFLERRQRCNLLLSSSSLPSPNKPELPGFLLIDPPFAAKVLTIVGLPPTPCRLDLFLLTALDFSPAVMLAAFAAGTHFGYDLPLFFDALFRPHS
jgi:hypothetical protein